MGRFAKEGRNAGLGVQTGALTFAAGGVEEIARPVSKRVRPVVLRGRSWRARVVALQYRSSRTGDGSGLEDDHLCRSRSPLERQQSRQTDQLTITPRSRTKNAFMNRVMHLEMTAARRNLVPSYGTGSKKQARLSPCASSHFRDGHSS